MILSVTGHRPSPSTFPATDRVLVQLRKTFREYLKLHEPDRVLTGMALGWDTACALACLDRGIPYVAVIPFVGQENRWEAYDQLRYRKILRSAEKVMPLSTAPPLDRAEATDLYHRRNRMLVDHSDRVCACLNPRLTRGGTYATVQYALSRFKRVDNLWGEVMAKTVLKIRKRVIIPVELRHPRKHAP